MTTKIKCACERDDCESTLEIQGNDIMWISEKTSVYDVLASIKLTPDVAEALRNAIEKLEH